MSVATIKQESLALKPQSRLRLVQEIWDSLVEEPEIHAVPEQRKRLIDRRLAAHEADPGAAITLAEAKRQVRRNLTRRK